MGTDIHIFREVKSGDRWISCEPVYGPTAKEKYEGNMPETAAEEMDYGRWYALFTILTETRGTMGASMSVTEFPSRFDVRGVPENVSEPVRAHIEFVKSDEGNCVHTFCNLYISEILAYLKHYHDEMLLTGNLPDDIVSSDEEGSDTYALVYKFDNGAYKGTPYETEKRMQLYEYIWNNYNPLMDFLTTLENTPCTGEFNGDFGKVDANNRRIIFYFDN